ncbi:MAG TPA: hypothetical protein VM529_25400 [Gemmata sp.]|nr:hypothetical protein [Gemmata sp.]
MTASEFNAVMLVVLTLLTLRKWRWERESHRRQEAAERRQEEADKRQDSMLGHLEAMLRMVEAHGAITDAQRQRVDQTMSVVVPTVRRAVDEVPEKVANKVVEKLNDQAAGDSGKYRHPDAK